MLNRVKIVDGLPIELTNGPPLLSSNGMDRDKLMRVLTCSTKTGRGTNNRGRRRDIFLVLYWFWTNGTWGIYPLFSFCCTMIIDGGVWGSWARRDTEKW